MTILLIIVAYVSSVFIARWFNKMSFKIDKYIPIFPFIWLIPLVGMLAYLVMFLKTLLKVNERSNWFTGKNW